MGNNMQWLRKGLGAVPQSYNRNLHSGSGLSKLPVFVGILAIAAQVIAPVRARVVQIGTPVAGHPTSGAIFPYVLVEFAKTAAGKPQPMVLSPSGRVIVTTRGKILAARAGTVGGFTRTAGIQEGINYAVATGADLYIEGRSAIGRTNNNVYFVHAPITIPATQDFRIDGGESVINYSPPRGDLLTIDSCEDCHYRFGLLVTGARGGCAVRFRPLHPTPIDGITVITDSSFRFSSIATAGSALPPSLRGPSVSAPLAGLFFDARHGPILFNRVYATAIISYQDNILLAGISPSHAVLANTIRVAHIHAAAKAEVKLNRYSNRNIFHLTAATDGQPGSGVITAGSYNIFFLDCFGFPRGRDMVLEPGGKGNIIISARPISFTNRSDSPNELIQGTTGAELLGGGRP